MAASLLYVDDQEENLRAFKRVFKRDFNIFTAISGEEGLDVFEKHPEITLLVSDQRMPGMSGVDFLNACKHLNPKPIRIIITGYADLESTINAINEAEIYRFIPKPWEPLDLKQTLLEAQKKYELVNELEIKNKHLESLDRLKNNFMMLVNHELKTPLTVQKSYLELLNEEVKDEEAKLLLAKSLGGTEKMEKMVEEIMFFLELQKRTDFSEKQPLNLKEIHEDLSDSKIKTDKKLFLEAFNRLYENALNHKKKDTKVKISLENKELIIENDLSSDKPPDLDLILKPFELHEEAFNHNKGLGLGLSIASLILNKLGFSVALNASEKFEVRINLKDHLES
jgi:CheY-like chemotaxis protein